MALELDDGVRLADAGALVTHGVLCSEPSLSVEERSRLSLGTFFALQERLVLFLVCLRDEDVGVRGVAARLAEEDDGTVASSSSFSSSSFSSFSGMPLRIGATVRAGWRRMETGRGDAPRLSGVLGGRSLSKSSGESGLPKLTLRRLSAFAWGVLLDEADAGFDAVLGVCCCFCGLFLRADLIGV